MLLQFTLSMPGINSWNGRWSGEESLYAIVANVGTSQKVRDKYAPIVEKGYFSYDFGDGWRAGVTVKEIDAKQARLTRKHSRGFCGYDWMVSDIRTYGHIRTMAEKEQTRAALAAFRGEE